MKVKIGDNTFTVKVMDDYRKRAEGIHHNCPPCVDEDCENYCGRGYFILEVEGGTCKNLGIKKGDSVKFLIN